MVKLNYDNKKSLESQKLIYKGLRKLLLDKPLTEITVTDIKDICNISRSTFYRNFNNVVDVLDVMFDFYYTRYLNNLSKEKDKFNYFFEYWKSHKDLVTIISKDAPVLLKKCIKKHYSSYNEFEINLKCNIFSTILSTWSNGKYNTTDVIEYTRSFLNTSCINILIN